MVYRPVIGKAVAVPAKLVAGKRVTVSFRVTRSDGGKPLSGGSMVCDPSVGGKLVRHVESFRNGLARLSFVVPKAAKGKQLRVKLTIKAPSYQGQDGSYIDVVSGQTGTVHTYYKGGSASKTVSLPVR